MRNLKMAGFGLVVLLAVLYGGLKAYVHYGVGSQLDAAADRVRPFGSLTYEDIGSDVRGLVSVRDVRLSLHDVGVSVRVGRIELGGDGPLFLLDIAGGLDPDDPPEAMRLALRGIEMSDLAELLPPQVLTSMISDPCGLQSLFSAAGALQSYAMPYLFDVDMSYDLDMALGTARLRFGYQVLHGETLSLEMLLSRVVRSEAMLQGAMPVLDKMTLEFEPNVDAVASKLGGCADQAGLDRERYVDGLLARSDKDLARDLGFVPGPGLRKAIKRFLLAPGGILLQFGPIEDPTALAALAGAPSAQAVDALKLRLAVNGEQVRDLSFALPDAAGSTAWSSPTDDGTAADGTPPPVLPRFIDTPPSELSRFVGRKVRVHASGRSEPHSGVLDAVVDEEIAVEQRVQSGTWTVHVPFAQIERVEVLRIPERE